MKTEAQRIAIAEACGFSDVKIRFWDGDERDPVLCGRLNGVAGFIPVADYLRDLNAMHEAEKVLTREQQDEYVDRHLYPMLPCDENHGPYDLADGEDILTASSFQIAHATAAQRSEAFLRTLGKWVEE